MNKYYKDPLLIVNSKNICPDCNCQKPAVKTCDSCYQQGFLPADLSGSWYPSPGFLVCGGPSINEIPYEKLGERGIVSLGINNIAGKVPVSAWCFSDPQEKFHHGLFLDPKVITFAPIPKLNKKIRIKKGNQFLWSDIMVRDCPNTYGFWRETLLYPENFLKSEYAMWGYGGKQKENEKIQFNCLATIMLGLRLMCYMGCTKIYLIGVDFLRTDESQYAFAQKASVSNRRYDHENSMLKLVRPYIENEGIKIYNCNPKSQCDAFQYKSFDDAFKDCKKNIPSEPFDLSGWYEKIG